VDGIEDGCYRKSQRQVWSALKNRSRAVVPAALSGFLVWAELLR